MRFAATRGLRVQRRLAERLVAAARDALPTADAAIARQVLAADLRLLRELEREIAVAEQELAILLPDSPFRTVMTVPGWGVVRAGNYAGALGDPDRWPGPAQIYRAAGLSPMQYESAGKRRDGSISREGSVASRRPLRPGPRELSLRGLLDHGSCPRPNCSRLGSIPGRARNRLVGEDALYNVTT